VTVGVLCMPEHGHFAPLRPVIRGFVARGHEVVVFSHAAFKEWVEASGARFVDLFAHHPLDEADGESRPVPCRYVSFAGHFLESLVELLRSYSVALIVYETFAVAGPVIGELLNVPYVNLSPAHNRPPGATPADLKSTPEKSVSSQCRKAIEKLHEKGFTNIDPFSYLSYRSPHLNLYCEPPIFLLPAERPPFEPLAFFGCLDLALGDRPTTSYFKTNKRRIYVSFGTVIWRYFAEKAERAIKGIEEAFRDHPEYEVLLSLGGGQLELESSSGFQVLPFVDQWSALQEADLIVTHQGMNTTHEAIYHQVPMVSYPFFADQPALCKRCVDLGLAFEMTNVRAEAIRGLVETVFQERKALRERLSEARRWEIEVASNRQKVFDRMTALTAG